jgi:hypothetical protein
MEAAFGARFADMWAGADLKAMRDTWAEGLAGIPGERLRIAVSRVLHAKFPPTLGEFLAMCEPPETVPPEHRPYQHPALTHQHVITPVGLAASAHVRELLAKHKLPKLEPGAGTDGIKWAFAIVRQANETNVPLNKLDIAQQAIAAWCANHGCSRDYLDENGEFKQQRGHVDIDLPPRVPSPHIVDEAEYVYERIPGEDDDMGEPA